MASTYSDLKIELIGTGEQTGTWGTTTNNNFSIALSEAITGSADVAFSSADVTVTLTDTNGAQAARNLRLNLTGTSGGARNLILGSGCQIEKLYLINNGLADAVTVKNTSGTGIVVPAGSSMFVFNNGTNVVEALKAIPVAAGGTGLATLTANNVILGNGTSAVQFVSPSTSGNVLTANGTTWTSAAVPAGGLTYVYKTANYTAVDKEGVLADTTGGAFTVTLPATPATGAQVVVADAGGLWGTNNLTVGRNGSTIAELAEDLVCNINGVSVQLVYDGSTWLVYAQIGGNGGTAVTLAGTQTLTNKTLTNPKVNGSSTVGGKVDLLEASNNGTNFIALKAPDTLSSDVTFTLPNTDGTSGQFLSTNGSGVLSFAAAAGGSLLRQTVFTSSGTWTKGAGTNFILIQGVGGGGGGSRRPSGGDAIYCGGAGGGYFQELIDTTGVTTVTVTIGAAGTGGSGPSATAPTAGGNTSFGAYATGNGGAAAADATSDGTAAGGTATGGDINIQGGDGSAGSDNTASAAGGGGNSIFGFGGAPRNSNAVNGNPGNGYGSGGGGANGQPGGGGATSSGGNGAAGIVIVQEFA